MPERSLRFGIISPEDGLCAASWKLWTTSDRRDVYTCQAGMKTLSPETPELVCYRELSPDFRLP
jgi:hypothetical protein